MVIMNNLQKHIDLFYKKHGKCCAGCDWWRYHNSIVGDCIKSAPVSASERYGMLKIKSLSCEMEAGHVLTKRDHVCGEFEDSYEW